MERPGDRAFCFLPKHSFQRHHYLVMHVTLACAYFSRASTRLFWRSAPLIGALGIIGVLAFLWIIVWSDV